MRTLAGVELTEKGKELLYFVEKSYNNLIIAERNMLETSNLQRGKLSIGMPSNVGSFFLFDKIIDFHKKYPNIEVTIFTGSSSSLINSLESHKVDFIIDTSPISVENKNLVIEELVSVDYAFIVNNHTSISDIDDICGLKDLTTKQLILPIPNTANRNDLDGLLQEVGVTVDNVLNVHTSEMIIGAVKKDLGIGYVIANLVDNEVKNGEMKILPIKEKLPTVMINLVYNPNYLTTAPLTFIKEYIKDINI